MQRWLLSVLALVALVATGCATTLPEFSIAEPTPVPATFADLPVTPTVAPAPTPAPGPGVLQLAVTADPTFDPLSASVVRPADMVVLDLLYDGLTQWDSATATWVPALAEDFQRASDRLSWTVTLRPATFSDGSPITASDVAYSLDRVLTGGPALPSTRLEMVSSVSALDERTVLIELSEPFALLPELLSSPVYGIVPRGDLNGGIGSGPLVQTAPGQLRARDDLEQALGFAGVDFVPVADDEQAAALRDAGDIDLAYVSAAFTGMPDEAAVSTVEAHYVLNAGSLRLQSQPVRQAVVRAVSRSAVSDAAFGEAAIAIDRMIPELLACVEPCNGTTADSELPTVEVPDLTIAYVDDASGREAAMADALVAELADAGIGAVATGYDIDTFVQRAAVGMDDLLRVGWVGLFPSPDSQLAPYQSTSSDNISAFAGDEFDALLAQARRFGDRASYVDAQVALVREAVVMPIARLQIRALVSDEVSGLRLRHDGTFDVAELAVSPDA